MTNLSPGDVERRTYGVGDLPRAATALTSLASNAIGGLARANMRGQEQFWSDVMGPRTAAPTATADDLYERIMSYIAEGAPVPVEMLAQFQAADPEGYALSFTGDDGTLLSPSEAAQMLGGDAAAPSADDRGGAAGRQSDAQRLRTLMDAIIEQMELPPDWQTDASGFRYDANELSRAQAFEAFPAVAREYRAMAEFESGRMTLDDGTVITQEMLNDPDPYVAAQWKQMWEGRRQQLENSAVNMFNEWQLDQYALDRESAQAENSRRTAEFNAAMTSIRERLARDQISLQQAQQEVDRILKGQQESRARADFETSTQLTAAPWATGGKTAFSPDDVGMGRLAQLGGIRDTSAPVIRYPGSTTVDPRGAIQYWDERGNVVGGTRPTPELSVSDADIPRGVSLGALPSAPRLAQPNLGNVIVMPGDPRYNAIPTWGYGAENAPQVAPIRLP